MLADGKLRFGVGAFIVAVIGIMLIVLGAQDVQDSKRTAFNYLSGVLGISLGWIMGIFLSPYNPDEHSKFSDYAKALSTFVSGYLLSKVDRLLDPAQVPAIMSDPQVVYRTMFFLACFFLTLVAVFLVRSYPVLKTDSVKLRQNPVDKNLDAGAAAEL